MAQFNVGDVVELKSGGPDMTVTRIRDNGSLRCTWFGKDDKPQYGSYKPEVLKLSGDSSE